MSTKLGHAFLYLVGLTLCVAAYAVRAARYLERDSPQGAPYKFLVLIYCILLGYICFLGLAYATGHAWEYGWRKW
jgi:hypothetical protein